MKIESIYINNFRLLKDFKLDLEDSLSLVLGKNNTGKTSILTCLDKFINSDKKKITAEDFNILYKDELERLVDDNKEVGEETYHQNIYGIRLRLVIAYDESDDTSNISDLMMDLEPKHNKIVLGYEYSLNYRSYKQIRQDYKQFKRLENTKFINSRIKTRTTGNDKNFYIRKRFHYFLKNYLEKYFKFCWKSIEYDYTNSKIIENNFNDLETNKIKSNLNNILNFKYISAKRNVANKENEKTLSTQTSEIYERSEKNNEDEEKIQNFKAIIEDTDVVLDNVYKGLFNDITEKVRQFGGIKKDESVIKVISSLHRRELLKGNTTVIYKHDDSEFPEHYNGLGYMNLISMIFEIEILLHEFRKGKDEKPSDINLLFIEEPEAHTHPQMQYIFIERITDLLKKGFKIEGEIHQLFQYVISTHSSHIVANCNEFNAIKYLIKEKSNDVQAKNVKDLEKEYTEADEEQSYRFLKQYLTLNRAELFFADKAIFIEGDTERILLPAMMRKTDIENNLEENELPILSQNISIIEVGAHSHIFERFIDFIGIKSLIITDLDTYYLEPSLDKDGNPEFYKNGKPKMKEVKCPSNDTQAKYTRNNALMFFHRKNNDIEYYKSLNLAWKTVRKNRKKEWNSNRKGKIILIFQTEEMGYHARSFEDGFFHINYDFIFQEGNIFTTLTELWLEKFKNDKCSFTLSEKGVESKPSLAIDILLNSNENYSNWQIPAYIKEGLLWLRKD
ncbi:ATP-dependent nuclease [Chryseobacterium limigenitum]|uniref:Predicted ATP-dependent endonuclease of the OLD family, contains P-loop ATPase and TOPRIM domains n=1 Tax=Chryseobacterium limigenitum TaxID=1612149 RepID=A0A1K2IXE3_9FLAO|nr:ATP-dependent endonuclease [Chryseobacterium limigenitum]SFZ97097.1 Predicted ATP-dependent endonuclease of the OLD family, contains P-loop ATPase and TOPRIM domains [Chryseobacterium limigenitum]